MQYAELLQFEYLESVIEIRDANQADKAQQFVSTYVISKEMAFRLINLVFVQLRFDHLSDNKGLLIVGNYGTGKSHLMAMISSIAENAEFLKDLKHQKVAELASTIAGKFHVLRTEIGATTMPLRDMLMQELETYLEKIDVHFRFPAADTIINNKGIFEDMMAAFEARYPEQGLLLVVDELLDYLRARSDQQLILDLSFLRELGEVCKNLRFRFIAGLQESIFDNQRFEFVANSLRRVKDRFEQILITRQDIKYVIAERLLKKTAAQKQQIADYLNQFAPCYGTMNERLAEFVAMFPVHPDYIDIFERLSIIEKREILKTLEHSVQGLICSEIPTDYPGLLTYDQYWQTLRENISFRTIPEVREVIDSIQVLENRIEQAFTRPAYKPMAIRIIHALAVHRLTTHDINAPVGVTAPELRDSLCLFKAGIDELGGNPAEDLLSFVETVLREILKTVNRQFISTNPENGQYYIDFKKNYDYDAIIEKRAESLDNHQLDRYYYTALRQVMEVSDTPTAGHQNWAYELEWRSHKVTRQGYLVFGTETSIKKTDNEAFLLYFLPVYSNLNSQLSVISAKNEVFFKLTKTDASFNQLLRLYTAAADLIPTSSGHAKSVYELKSQTYLREILQWLQTNKATAFEVSSQGKTQMLLAWLEEQADDFRVKNNPALFNPHPSLLANFRDLIELIADVCLDSYFLELAPDYPSFPILVSHENLAQIAQEALRGIINPNRSKQAEGILRALLLLNRDNIINPNNSKYAQAILTQLHQKPAAQVLNQTELRSPYRLEPELIIILIAALVSTGEIVLVLPKQTYDTSNLAELAATPIKELITFRHLERPKAFNLPALKALFELLSLPSDLATALTQNEDIALQQLQTKISDTLRQILRAQQGIAQGFRFWGKPILSKAETQHYRTGLAEIKTFLETLQAYSTPLKFKNFKYTAGAVTAQWSGLKILQNLNQLIGILSDLNPSIAYLTTAEATLPPQHNWRIQMSQVRDKLHTQISDIRQRNQTGFSYHAQQQLNALQKSYITAYIYLHQQARLGTNEEAAKQSLIKDKRLFNLKKLAKIGLLPRQQLNQFETSLNQLPICYTLTENDLTAQTICPHCGYKPIYEGKTIEIKQLQVILGEIEQNWTKILLSELEHTATERELLKVETRDLLESFLLQRRLPDEISETFINAVQEGLAGLQKVIVNLDALQQALLSGGSPMTVTEIQKRFINHINKLTMGKNLNQVRIVLE
jgi:hypothetical protein